MINTAYLVTSLLLMNLAMPSGPKTAIPVPAQPSPHQNMPPAPAMAPAFEARLPASIDLTPVRSLVVQFNGRWMPLDTLARDLIHEVTGRNEYRGHDPLIILLAWTFDRTTWMQQPMIEISNAELRGELGLPVDQTQYSFKDLVSTEKLLKLIEKAEDMPPGKKPDPLESKVLDIREKLTTIQTGLGGTVIHLIPDAENAAGSWKAIPVAGPASPPKEAPAREAWGALGKAFRADDAKAFSVTAEQLRSALASLPAKHRPSAELIETELDYNQFQPFRKAWMIMAIGAFLAIIALLAGQRWLDYVVMLPLIAGFGVTSYGLWLRWQIAGSIPASNMYESLLFLGWGMGLFAILTRFVFRQGLVLLTASVMAALALFLADVLPLDPFIRPVAPVLLDTIWMAIHVPVIMVSYSVLAIGVLIAHVQLVVMAAAPRSRSLTTAIDSLHYWYIHVGSILLTAGIITGSMWAASSWGRYWGWDPKEVWSLIALLGYLTILHTRQPREYLPAWAYLLGGTLIIAVFGIILVRLSSDPGTIAALGAALVACGFLVLGRGAFATSVKSILCFWMILMTYVGVNYILGIGLHSYGFGTGAVAKKMFLIGSIDLALIAALSGIYISRRGWESPATGPVALKKTK